VLQNFIKSLFLFLAILAFPVCSKAQIELSSGIDVNNPFLTNKYSSQLYYKQTDFGLHFGVSYKPTGTQFFPTLNFGFGLYKLPLRSFDNDVAVVNMDYLNLMLNGNYVVTFENDNSLYLIGGIGFADLKHTYLSVTGKNSGASQIALDSTANITTIFPAIGLGMEYVYGSAVNQNLYLSMGFYVQYIYLFDDENSYYVTVQNPQHNSQALNSNLVGHIIVPNFYLSLHFLMGKNIIFWKKHDSKYL
jgi:hypothetical protein